MKKFLAILSSFSGLVFFVLALTNLFLSWKAYNAFNTVVVTNCVEVSFLPTNSISSTLTNSVLDSFIKLPSSLSNTNPPSSSDSPRESFPTPRRVAEFPYQYFLVGRRIGAHMFGRYYYESSPCSYGRISAIYPDRILLSNGDWIENSIYRLTENSRNGR